MHALALIQTDPDQAKQAFAAVAGMMGILMFVFLAFRAFTIFLFWRTLTKAGFSGPLALIGIIAGIGDLVLLCILAFGDWKVVPAPQQTYGYPPPPTYPPAA